ncbi:hypothetical protein IAU60_004921 [Kwoniella sp. DSM 27419]
MSAPTPSRSRKSSVTSRRAPASLRLPTAGRKASSTQLSIIFAQRESSVADAGSSEQVLSRQLDGATGGRQMGLRSRQSSSATLATVRTTSGLRSPSPDHVSVKEEDERAEGLEEGRGRVTDSPGPMAGPSTAVSARPTRPSELVPPDLPDPSPSSSLDRRTLNPKQSSSWLRWTSPAPSFPRSPSADSRRVRGKGRQRERVTSEIDAGGDTEARAGDSPSGAVAEASTTNKATAMDTPAPVETSGATTPTPAPDIESVSDRTPAPVFHGTKSRGWFTRTVPAKPPQPPAPTPQSPAAGIPAGDELAPAHDQSDRSVDSPPMGLGSAQLVVPDLAASSNTPAADQTEETMPTSQSRDTSSMKQAQDPVQTRRWKGYLGWRGTTEPSTPAPTARASSPEVEPAIPALVSHSESDAPESDARGPPSEPSLSDPAHGDLAAQPTRPDDSAQPAPSGWSSYLYSFVGSRTPVSQTPVNHTPHPIAPTLSDEAQQPATARQEPEPVAVTVSPPPTDAPTSKDQLAANATDRRGSSASVGWLNYLAFRASQKTIGAKSIHTVTDGAVRHSTPGSEEVMDFSSDPDFPAAAPGPLGPTNTIKPDGAESVHSAAKPSQALTVQKKKRLSNASMASNASATAMSVSPRGRSPLDSHTMPHGKPLGAPAIAPGGSTPANLVLPTFATTFDRPPRSFQPIPDQPDPPTTPQGLTAATTGLAWRALGAVGSYVYGGEAAPKPTPESIPEDQRETRGRKEGRKVGAELPRRIGLGVGHPDDGWKQVRRVVVVGVHGWFPAKMLNSVIGEPTGTSVKFANMMAQAVRQFFADKGVDDLRLTLMPLEGEGTIESRVDKLYKAYLSNPAWINDLRRADAVFFAAHSQGCIVTTHLISRMVAQGHIRTRLNSEAVSRCEWAFGPIGVVPDEPRRGIKRGNSGNLVSGSEGGFQKVAMLAMCGVHLGPLYSISTSSVIQPYLQWFENAAARELFEFQDTTSAVSVAYQKALSMVLENEVKVVLLASLNDQVVPIYGSSFCSASHPLLLRALYVDGVSHSQSDFMTQLLCFAFMLRNAGIDDQRLVEHLSEATAGSLTEISCYALAVDYLFHSGPATQPVPPLGVEPFSARDAKNDFELPWIMRALVDSPEVKDLFPDELAELKEGILAWRPTTKALREIKRRLEPMAGRQSRLRNLHASPSSHSLASATEQAALQVSPGSTKALASGLRRDW